MMVVVVEEEERRRENLWLMVLSFEIQNTSVQTTSPILWFEVQTTTTSSFGNGMESC